MSTTRLVSNTLAIAEIKKTWLYEDFGTGVFVWLQKMPESQDEYLKLKYDLESNSRYYGYFEGKTEDLPLLYQAINTISNQISLNENNFTYEIIDDSFDEENDELCTTNDSIREESPLFTLKQESDCENKAEVSELKAIHSTNGMRIYFYKKSTDKELEIMLEKLPVTAQDYADLIADINDSWSFEEKGYRVGGMTYLIADRFPNTEDPMVKAGQVKEIEDFITDLTAEFHKIQNAERFLGMRSTPNASPFSGIHGFMSPSMEKSIASTITDNAGSDCVSPTSNLQNSDRSNCSSSPSLVENDEDYFMGCRLRQV